MRLAIFAALPQRMNFLPPMMAVATGPELTLMQDAICRPPNFRLGYDGLRIKGEVDISAGYRSDAIPVSWRQSCSSRRWS
jgi:hypothetical protein